MKTTLRERIESEILNYFEILDSKGRWMDGFMEVIESEIALAEDKWYQEWKARAECKYDS